MADVEVNVALPPDLVAELRLAAASGEHGSMSDIVREALVAWRRDHGIGLPSSEELRRLAQEGIDSGPGLDADEVFSRLRARFGRPAAE